MERFDEFLESVKKVEIEDEEFKRGLKKKLLDLYDKRKEIERAFFYRKAVSFAVIILLIIIPSIFIYKNIYLRKSALIQKPELFRTMNVVYEEEINKIILNDEIESTEIKNDGTTIKKYKSGVIISEKEGNFQKILFNENFLKENYIDLEKVLKSAENLKTFDKILINKILNIFKEDIRFEFINENNIESTINIKDNLYLIKVLGNRGYWIIILDIVQNKILYFIYPY
ncbi:MAG: hypothetical protein N3D74_05245 [Caldisericia bacterium]|nr:hypothetical protein [Caldisericia bacterium]